MIRNATKLSCYLEPIFQWPNDHLHLHTPQALQTETIENEVWPVCGQWVKPLSVMSMMGKAQEGRSMI